MGMEGYQAYTDADLPILRLDYLISCGFGHHRPGICGSNPYCQCYDRITLSYNGIDFVDVA